MPMAPISADPAKSCGPLDMKVLKSVPVAPAPAADVAEISTINGTAQ